MHKGGRICLKYLKRGWNRKDGRGSKDFKKGDQARSRVGCLKKGGGTGTPLETMVISVYSDFYLSHFQPRPTLKNCFFPITHITKKLFTWATGKTFFYLKLNITFYFKCCLHNNCSVNLN